MGENDRLERLSVRIEGSRLTPVVTLQGELDGHTVPRLDEVLGEVIDAGAVEVVLDVSRLSAINSEGLRALISVTKRLPSMDHLRIRGARGMVRELLEISGLRELFGRA